MELQDWLTLGAIFVALFGREFIDYLKKPKLVPYFDVEDVSYFHKILFPLFFYGDVEHFSNGMNCLLKISNPRKRFLFIKTATAVNCEAKVTYIYHYGRKFTYHPTWLKWSGVDEETPVSIMSGSHHFLDFIKILNFNDELLIKDDTYPNAARVSAIRPDSLPKEITLPEEKIFFEPWVPNRHHGITRNFLTGGTFLIYLILNAENCDPVEYEVSFDWSRSRWDHVELKLQKIDNEYFSLKRYLVDFLRWMAEIIKRGS